jgi:hypothetical protein
MARAEQKYLIDRETLDHLLAMLRDGVAKGASDEEIREQTLEILDPDYRAKVDRALKEAAEGKVRRFKNAEEMIRDLHSR